jgi:glycosyltransferase involved in cell wall biosynthesis
MRIVLITNYLPPYEGGIQFVVDELAARYEGRGHRVAVLGFDATTDRVTTSAYRRVAIRGWNPLESRNVPVPLFEPASLLSTLRRELQRADAVHIHGVLFPANALAATMAARRRLRVVVTEHVGIVRYKSPPIDALQALAFRTVGRACLRRAHAVTVLNERVREELEPLLPPETPVLRIPNGVDTKRFVRCRPVDRISFRAAWNFSRPTILFVGRLTTKKRIDLLIGAANRTTDWDLVICGKDTEQLTTTERLPSNVRVLGLLDRDQLVEVYNAADLLALVSEGEGFPLVVQEAMACGLPVVVTDNQTNREYLGNKAAAFVGQDAQEIARVVAGLLADSRELNRGANAAAEFAGQAFDWDVAVDQYLSLLSTEPRAVRSAAAL